MAEKVHKCGIRREEGYLYFVDSTGDVSRVRRGESQKEVVCPNKGEFTKESGYVYYLDKAGDVSRAKMKSFREFAEVRDEVMLGEENWIKGAINPKHRGFCTPLTKKTCTPRRKALAL